MRDEILALVSKFFLDWIEPFYKKTIEWFEYPEILRYNVGGYYWPHSDADNWIQDDQAWSRSLDRDLSILFYLNEEYEGGEIEFPNFRFRLTPERGMLVCFPSDHRFLHAAQETTGGQRYVLVSWAAAAETERVREDPPARAIFLKR